MLGGRARRRMFGRTLDLKLHPHRGAARADARDHYAAVGMGIGLGVWIRCRVESSVVAASRIRISRIAAIGVVLQVALAVRLHQRNLVVIFIRIGLLCIVDVPDQQSAARQ